MSNNAIPIYFSIPAEYTSTQNNGPLLVNPSRVTFSINPPIKIPADHSCHLTSASICFSQPNVAGALDQVASISNGNNRITITYNGIGPADYLIPLGLYSVTDVELALNQIARDNGWVTGTTELFILTGISATQKIIFSVNPGALSGGVFPAGGIIIEFINPSPATGLNNSMGPLLGFPGSSPAIVIPGGGNTIFSVNAPNAANFANISAYNLYVSFLGNSYQNGSIGQLLYSFPIGSYTPNSVFQYQPSLKYPVPCQPNTYSTIDVWTTDQSGNLLPWKYYQSPFSFSCLIQKNTKK